MYLDCSSGSSHIAQSRVAPPLLEKAFLLNVRRSLKTPRGARHFCFADSGMSHWFIFLRARCGHAELQPHAAALSTGGSLARPLSGALVVNALDGGTEERT